MEGEDVIIRHKEPFHVGYNPVAVVGEQKNDTQMEFGIVKMAAGQKETFSCADKEKAYLLITGDIIIEWQDKEERLTRGSFLDENSICLHVPKAVSVSITSLADAELAVFAAANQTDFEPVLYSGNDCTVNKFGDGVLNNTSLREVRTVFDNDNAPYSNMVLGEVINYPGRWSSYPPHHHSQPEVYHYRFFPARGFGISEIGDNVYKVFDQDTAVIPGGLTHMQASAPGYAMYYIWAIPHLKGNRWNKDRVFLDRDKWMLEPDAKIWPDR